MNILINQLPWKGVAGVLCLSKVTGIVAVSISLYDTIKSSLIGNKSLRIIYSAPDLALELVILREFRTSPNFDF